MKNRPMLTLDDCRKISAAAEAVLSGIPGIAVSTDHPDEPDDERDYRTAAVTALHVAEKALAEGLPKGLVLNVNVPHLPEDRSRGWRITRQGIRIYEDELVTNFDPRGNPYYWIGGKFPSGKLEEGTDIGHFINEKVQTVPGIQDTCTILTFKAFGR